jgi:glutathione S-transferase
MTSQYEIHSFGFADRSARVRWTLAELGLKVAQEHTLGWDNGDLDKPEYLALNPMGMSPTLIEDGKAIWESIACCVYLADKYSHLKALAPSLTSPHRAQYLQWTYFIAAEMDMKFNDLMMAHFSEDEARKKDAPMLEADLQYMARVLDKELATRDYLVAGEFSVADIVAGSITNYMFEKKLLKPAEFPKLHVLVARLKERPAAKASQAFKTFGED